MYTKGVVVTRRIVQVNAGANVSVYKFSYVA